MPGVIYLEGKSTPTAKRRHPSLRRLLRSRTPQRCVHPERNEGPGGGRDSPEKRALFFAHGIGSARQREGSTGKKDQLPVPQRRISILRAADTGG